MSSSSVAKLADLQREVRRFADPADAEFLQRFFKTGPGQYGEGDRFLGIRVPPLRRLARHYRGIPFEDVMRLLASPWHEERLLALLILVERYRRAEAFEREAIYQAYLANTVHINSWDLVDVSTQYIVGAHLDPEDISVLERLAVSESLWERRIAIMSTFEWIKRDLFGPTLVLAERLRDDRHDLIHKAVGWMLREVGNRDRMIEERFLRRHYATMPRTMLRYAIERFPEDLRKRYLKGEV